MINYECLTDLNNFWYTGEIQVKFFLLKKVIFNNNFLDYQETVEVFLSRATVTDETDVDGRSAFMWAAGKGADHVVAIFIKHNVDIQQVDKNGGTGRW